jgi:hypothetical protein
LTIWHTILLSFIYGFFFACFTVPGHPCPHGISASLHVATLREQINFVGTIY